MINHRSFEINGHEWLVQKEVINHLTVWQMLRAG
jgi:hypothetical protein